MELSKANMFYKLDINESGKVFRSKDLQKLMDMNDGELYDIYAAIDTPNGEKLFEVDWSSSGDVVIMQGWMQCLTHTAFILKYYDGRIVDV